MRTNLFLLLSILLFLSCKKNTSQPSDNYLVTTVAGDGSNGYKDGQGSAAKFSTLMDITVDNQGNLFVADYGNHCVRKISSSGQVTTLAGNRQTGHVDGPGHLASFDWLSGIAIDNNGNAYVGDKYRIRKITSAGVVSTIAGGDSPGSMDGQGLDASFGNLGHMAADANGNIYVVDDGTIINKGYRIRKITPSGAVSTFVELNFFPIGLSIDDAGNLNASNSMGSEIVKIAPDKSITPIIRDVHAYIMDICSDREGGFYFIQSGYFDQYHAIYKLDLQGTITRIAGSDDPGYAEGSGTQALFRQPIGLVADAQKNIYVLDSQNWRIRKISRK
ncbi:MAG: hypothetical protein ACHQFX_21085 [Chitinophagales bacterium]